jgi:hypothetical protein
MSRSAIKGISFPPAIQPVETTAAQVFVDMYWQVDAMRSLLLAFAGLSCSTELISFPQFPASAPSKMMVGAPEVCCRDFSSFGPRRLLCRPGSPRRARQPQKAETSSG